MCRLPLFYCCRTFCVESWSLHHNSLSLPLVRYTNRHGVVVFLHYFAFEHLVGFELTSSSVVSCSFTERVWEESSTKWVQQECKTNANRRQQVQTSANERKSKTYMVHGIGSGARMIADNSSVFVESYIHFSTGCHEHRPVRRSFQAWDPSR